MEREIICNINKGNRTDMQVIYCSQLYGTFFSVSAILNVEQNENNEEVLSSMELFLLNYKGHFNIGILKEETVNTLRCKGTHMTLCLHLKANEQMHGLHNGVVVPCNVKLSDLEGLTVNRKLHPIHENLEKRGDHLKQRVFDDEFYRRDGTAIRAREIVDHVESSSFEEDHDLLTSGRCETTISRFI